MWHETKQKRKGEERAYTLLRNVRFDKLENTKKISNPIKTETTKKSWRFII